MTTTTSNKKPAATVRDGSLKATIWQNEGEKGAYFSVQITRTWKDEQGTYHDSDRFGRNELLRVAHLATRAYDELAKLHAQTGEDAAD